MGAQSTRGMQDTGEQKGQQGHVSLVGFVEAYGRRRRRLCSHLRHAGLWGVAKELPPMKSYTECIKAMT